MFRHNEPGRVLYRLHRGIWTLIGALGLAVPLVGCSSAGSAGAGGSIEPPDNNELPDDTLAREIEEADIVKYEDGYFYLANRWTGLRILDAGTIERPLAAGRVPLQGRAVELFVRDDYAFILSSADFFYCAGEPIGFREDTAPPPLTEPDYEGSRITVVDVSDKWEPVVVAQFDLDGFVSATRRVGDVIYAAGTYPDDYTPPDDEDDGDTNGDLGTNGDANTNGDVGTNGDAGTMGAPSTDTGRERKLDLPTQSIDHARAFVASINIADPGQPYLADREIFYGDSFAIHVSTQDAMFVAGVDPTMLDTTVVTYVDISDPQGEVRLRDQFRVPGVIRNRFFMDEDHGIFRIVVEEFYGVYPTLWAAALYHYDVTDPDHVLRLARLPLTENQGMRSVRFDGARAYAVTATISDPLFVLDLSDPYEPAVAGQLEILGTSTHLVPLGERLLSVGVDSSHTHNPSLTLFDVSDPWEPQPMSRIVLGQRDDGVTSEANFDERAVRVLEDERLILMPFAHRDSARAEWVDAVQLIDLWPTRLADRGTMTHRGLVRRCGVTDDRLWMLSDEAFKVADIDDRDDPRGLAGVELINEQDLLDSGLWSCVDSARFRWDEYDDVYGPGPYYGMACGTGVPAALLLSTLGLMAFSGWRRPGCNH